MAKVQIGFRFRPEVAERLGELAEAGGVTRTRVLEELVMAAVRGGATLPPAPQRERYGDHDPTPGPRTRPDLDKIAEFQRTMVKKK
jgi:hypothetical protein